MIVMAAEYSQAAQLNQPTGEQLRRELEMRQTVRAAVEGVIAHDLELIETIVTRTMVRAESLEAAHA
ncbi:hypothetical protein vBPaeMUSP18_01 [Pseudomonas phage vB_PaeM_USP_18]|nr:hypothetical protein vBPaeMUSP18_01 [Pseudomonas phage vB_PaeM_USP_18]QLI49528.1 hypothetical protein vBPaeMUSP25_01 [Pseudomonas phage vB_PaeM_USP_25]